MKRKLLAKAKDLAKLSAEEAHTAVVPFAEVSLHLYLLTGDHFSATHRAPG